MESIPYNSHRLHLAVLDASLKSKCKYQSLKLRIKNLKFLIIFLIFAFLFLNLACTEPNEVQAILSPACLQYL